MKLFIDKILAMLLPSDSYGKVVKVVDGDTVKIELHSTFTIDLRLSNIDAPEKSQPFGKESQLFLESLILNRIIRFKASKKDRYGRNIGEIFLRFTNINKKMVASGAAFCYDAYLEDPSYKKLENKAKRKLLGVWRKNLQKPWNYRNKKRLIKQNEDGT